MFPNPSGNYWLVHKCMPCFFTWEVTGYTHSATSSSYVSLSPSFHTSSPCGWTFRSFSLFVITNGARIHPYTGPRCVFVSVSVDWVPWCWVAGLRLYAFYVVLGIIELSSSPFSMGTPPRQMRRVIYWHRRVLSTQKVFCPHLAGTFWIVPNTTLPTSGVWGISSRSYLTRSRYPNFSAHLYIVHF